MSVPSEAVKLAGGVGAAIVTVSVVVAIIVLIMLIFGNAGPESVKWKNVFSVWGFCFKGFMVGLLTCLAAEMAEAFQKSAAALQKIAERKP